MANKRLLFLIQRTHVCVLVCVYVCVQSLQTLCDAMDCSLLSSSVHRILQARILGCLFLLPKNSFKLLIKKLIGFTKKKKDFPSSSAGREPASNVGDSSQIPGSGRSLEKYSWASLVAQLVKNPPAMWDTQVRSLGWEDLLKKGMAIHSSTLAWRIPWTIHGVAKSPTQLSDFHFQFTKKVDITFTKKGGHHCFPGGKNQPAM